MSTTKISGATKFTWAAAMLLLAMPGVARVQNSTAYPPQSAEATTQFVEIERGNEADGDRWQDQADSSAAKREREQDKRDREQEKRDREQERRDRDQERIDRQEELYDNGREALDDEKYEQARKKFSELAKANGPQTDAALYWSAYAEQRLGQRQAALAAIADLKKRFPQSRWQKDASALEIEVRQGSGQPSRPENQSNEELRMLAIQSLMNSDPDRAMPLLEKVLQGSASPKEKSKALFVLAQGGTQQGREIIGRIAKGQSNPELQRKAVE